MSKCLVSLTEETAAMAIALKLHDGDSLDSVIRRHLARRPSQNVPATSAAPTRGGHSATLFGAERQFRTIQDLLYAVVERLAERDKDFCSRLSLEQGRKRRIIARTPEALYPGSPHLAKFARELSGGWWLATNCSRRDVARAIQIACDVAKVRNGADIAVAFF